MRTVVFNATNGKYYRGNGKFPSWTDDLQDAHVYTRQSAAKLAVDENQPGRDIQFLAVELTLK